MSSTPDWNSITGQVVRGMEIPDCDCDHSLIPCGCSEPCDCHPLPPPPCPHVLAPDHNMPVEKWARLLALFDPAEYRDPPQPPAKALMLSHADSVQVMDGRFGPKARDGSRVRHLKGRYALRHPDDVTPHHEAADETNVQGCKGRREGNMRTNRLTHLEHTLLESLEEQIVPAHLLWPWKTCTPVWLRQAARALVEIRDRQLWRELALSFEKYAKKTFDFLSQDIETLLEAGGYEVRRGHPETVPFASVFEVSTSPRPQPDSLPARRVA